MIDLLDNLMRDLLLAEVDSLTDEEQVRFQPPDEDWRTYVANLTVGGEPAMALNVYLVELRENRKLRSNERVRSIDENGYISEESAPARLDCHYLITAWSPAEPSPTVESTLDEHALLYDVVAAFFRASPLNPARVYPSGSAALNAWPERFREVDLPTLVAPVEGFAKLAEFWSAMGEDARWKPTLPLVVTVPVELVRGLPAPMVTTRITEYRQTGRPETAETWIQIGGHVLDTTHPLPDGSPAPVDGAWVRLETLAGAALETTETNARGRFAFSRLRPDQYRLRTVAVGLGEKVREVEVPTQTGEYDLHFP
jgi:5-hydroxyisourate hydrolase-like protein (transthyretin family)